MLICKDCRCYHPVSVSDRYCGDCCIGDSKNPIAINADITGCCLFEPKQPKKPKKLTNGDRIRQMTDEELAEFIDIYDIEDICRTRCAKTGEARERCMCYDEECKGNIMQWLKQEVEKDAESDIEEP